jgi:hypothetical protein
MGPKTRDIIDETIANQFIEKITGEKLDGMLGDVQAEILKVVAGSKKNNSKSIKFIKEGTKERKPLVEILKKGLADRKDDVQDVEDLRKKIFEIIKNDEQLTKNFKKSVEDYENFSLSGKGSSEKEVKNLGEKNEQSDIKKISNNKPVEKRESKDSKKGALYAGEEGGKERFFRVVIDERASKNNDAYVNILTDKGWEQEGWKFRFKDKQKFRAGEAEEILKGMGYEEVEEDAGVDEEQESKNFPTTLREFDEDYKRAVMEEGKFIRDGVYVNQEDNSVLEIYFYNPNNGKVEIYQGAIKKGKGEKGENVFDMPDRRGKDPEETSKVSFSEFEDIMKDYKYVSGDKKGEVSEAIQSKKKGNFKDDIEEVVDASVTGNLNEGEPEESDKGNEVTQDEKVEIGEEKVPLTDKEILESKIKAFEKEFYPDGGMYKANPMFKIGRLELDENDQELKVFITLRKNGKKIRDGQMSVERFRKIYNKGKEETKGHELMDKFLKDYYPIRTTLQTKDRTFFMKILDIKMVDGSLRVQISKGEKGIKEKEYKNIKDLLITVDEFKKICDDKEDLKVIEGNSKIEGSSKKEKRVEFTEEEKKYIEKQLFPFFDEEMQRIDKWLEYYKSAGYETDVLEGMKKEQKKILLKGMEAKLKETSSKNGLLKGKIPKLIKDLTSK